MTLTGIKIISFPNATAWYCSTLIWLEMKACNVSDNRKGNKT
jgi:hypothetical protein